MNWLAQASALAGGSSLTPFGMNCSHVVIQRSRLIALQPQGHFIFLLAPFLRFIDLPLMSAKLFAHVGFLTRKKQTEAKMG
jgi:hypothetical protein